MPRPVTKVEIAFNVGVTGTPTWTDVTSKVRVDPGIDIQHWRGDEDSETQASRLSLTLMNNDGRYTPGNASGFHYPNIKRNRPIRVRSTHNGVTYDRFTGYVDDWVVDWPATVGTISDCAVTASSRMSRLGRGTELRSLIEEEAGADNSLGHYTLGEPEGSTRVSDSTGRNTEPLALAGTGAPVTFGTAIGPGTDGLTAGTFPGGKYLTGSVAPITTASALYLGCWFLSSTAASLNDIVFASLSTSATGGRNKLRLSVRTTGQVRASFVPDSGGTQFVETAGSLTDGATHHVLAVFVAGSNLRLYVDGVLVDTTASTLAGETATVDGLTVGGTLDTTAIYEPFNGTLAHVYYGASSVSASRAADHNLAGTTGFAGETSAEWIDRLASYAGVAAADTDTTGSTQIAVFDPTGATALDVMRRVETTEGGVLFDALDGTLTLLGRDDRYAATSAFTVSYTGREIAAPPRPVLDDQRQVNDMTATNADGVIGYAIDQSSIDDDGLYRDSVELATNDPDEPLLRAGWIVSRYSEAVERISELEILLNTADNTLAAGVLSAQVGTKLLLESLPANAPASSMSLFVEGRAERITMSEDRVTLHTSPAELWDVFTIGTTALGQFDAYPLAY